MSPLSVYYCAWVRAYLVAAGSSLVVALPPLPASIGRAHPSRKPGGFVNSKRFWASWTRRVEAPRAVRASR